ncbi:MAG: elongation factor G [Caldilineaceae bacterium]|nr:elongation factor G [Caldilineaceae bacterium]
MAEFPMSNIRNISLLGHSRSGKTTLVEALLYHSSTIPRMGDTADGSTVCDFDDEEKARGISLSLAAASLVHNGIKVNLVDTPGDPGFLGEVISGVAVTEMTLILVDAVAGAEVGTELAWARVQAEGQPVGILVNKMDRENADWERALESLEQACPGATLVPFHLPVGQALDFRGIVDLAAEAAWMGDSGRTSDLPDDLSDEIEEARMVLVEAAAESDDELMEKYLEGEDLSAAEVQKGLSAGVAGGTIVPVFVCSATAGIGVHSLLDRLVEVAPGPDQAELPLADGGQPEPEDEAPVLALTFRTIIDRYRGRINYVRVFRGTLAKGGLVRGNGSKAAEPLVNLHAVQGNDLDNLDAIGPGDIGAVSKLTGVQSGQALYDADSEPDVVLPTYPNPLFSMAVAPATQADSAKLGQSLSQVAEEDPTLSVVNIPETKQTVIQGIGEIQVDVALKRLETGFGVGVLASTPKVPYMETVTRVGQARYRHKKQSGGAGQFAEVHMRVEPLDRGSGFQYESEVYGGAISTVYLPSIEKGVKQVMEEGVVAGFPAVDLKVVVYDGKEHPVDSKDIAFQIAGREVFKMAANEAGATLLEPIYSMDISVPEDYMGDIMGDLTNRRGRVLGMEQETNRSVVKAEVPFAEIMRYGTDLRSMTQGRGTYEIDFLHYEEVPKHLVAKVIEGSREMDEDE